MRVLFLVLGVLFSFGVVQAQGATGTPATPPAPAGTQTAQTVTGALQQVDGFINGGAEAVEPITDAIEGVGDFLGTNQNTNGNFDANKFFPAWGDGGRVRGVIGSNNGPLNQGPGKLLIYFIPKVIELLIWVVAPVITVMFMYSGIQFIYGGDREEEVKKARDFFRYAAIGLVFVVLSYSFMKAVFFILVPN